MCHQALPVMTSFDRSLFQPKILQVISRIPVLLREKSWSQDMMASSPGEKLCPHEQLLSSLCVVGRDPVRLVVPRIEKMTDLHVFSFAWVINVFKGQRLYILSRQLLIASTTCARLVIKKLSLNIIKVYWKSLCQVLAKC